MFHYDSRFTRILLAGLLLCLCLMGSACIKNANLTAPQAAIYQTNRTVAVLAETNKGVAASVIKLSELKLLQPDLTNEVLNYNRSVALAVKSSVAILQSGKSWSEIAPEVLKLLQNLPLPQKTAEFLKAPTTDQGVLALISAISSTQLLVQQAITEARK